MIATHLGFYNTSSTRTHVRFQFSTHAAAGGNVAPNSAFESADLRIYRANDGAAFSATQRSSANGITMTSPFDSLTGFHDVDIDLTDNTDSGFYTAGYLYTVVLAPDETVDSQTLTGVVLAYFEIGVRKADVVQFGGSAGTFASGIPEVKVASIANNAIAAAAIASDALTNAKFANDAITAAKLHADVTTELQSGLATAAALSTLDGKVDTIDDFLDTEIASIITKIDAVDDFLDTEIAAILAAVDTEVAAIKAKTDPLTFTVANQLDANVQSINDALLEGDGTLATPWGPA